MRFSKLVAERTKELPSEAKMPSHILLLRAGYIKQVANGIFTLTNLGQKTSLNIENIIREEMNNIDGQEVKFPVVMPKELWDLSGRYNSIGNEMVRFLDRNNHSMLLGMTHEEASVHLTKNWVNSYTQLPFMIYQIQTKFRDEPRSRGGLIRVREFTMKDAYSFHMTQEDLEEYYNRVHTSYENIFKKIGLRDFISVKGDTGMMGGDIAHEFMFLSDFGEDELILCDACGFKANQEVAKCVYETPKTEKLQDLKEVETGNAKEILEVCKMLNVKPEKTIKAVAYAIKKEEGCIVCFLRGDKEVNESKLKKLCKKEIVPYDAISDFNFCAGNIGPLNLNIKNCTVFFDNSLIGTSNMIIGANKKNKHIINFTISRDLKDVQFFDISKVLPNQICPICGQPILKIKNGIEIGNIFQLGTKYTKTMQMFVKNSNGEEVNPLMACYGIGVGRNLACVIEQNNDENGICMPMSIAPYKVHICPLRLDDKDVKDTSFDLYSKLKQNGVDVLIDDRDCTPGVKFADADLIGMPIRVVVSPRTLKDSKVEIKVRKTNQTVLVELKNALETILNLIKQR